MRGNKAVKIVKVLVMVAVAVVAFGWVTMQLWNYVVPGVFGGKAITFGQAVALLVLSKILFGGFGRRGGGRPGWARRGWGPGMAGRWEAMSPEERERFRAGMRGRWGCRPRPASESGEQTVG